MAEKKKPKKGQTDSFNPDYFSYTSDYQLEKVWNTNNTIAQLIVPRLLAFKDLDKHGYPGDFNDMRAWNKAIQKMADAFELLIDEDKLGIFTKDEEEAIEHGLELFSKYFRYLWD